MSVKKDPKYVVTEDSLLDRVRSLIYGNGEYRLNNKLLWELDWYEDNIISDFVYSYLNNKIPEVTEDIVNKSILEISKQYGYNKSIDRCIGVCTSIINRIKY